MSLIALFSSYFKVSKFTPLYVVPSTVHLLLHNRTTNPFETYTVYIYINYISLSRSGLGLLSGIK